MGDAVFQVSELVELYRVALSIDLEENLNFHVFDNIFVNVDVEELNVVLSSSGQAQVNKDDDNNDINVEYYDGAGDESIKEEEDNSD
jgi:transposase